MCVPTARHWVRRRHNTSNTQDTQDSRKKQKTDRAADDGGTRPDRARGNWRAPHLGGLGSATGQYRRPPTTRSICSSGFHHQKRTRLYRRKARTSKPARGCPYTATSVHTTAPRHSVPCHEASVPCCVLSAMRPQASHPKSRRLTSLWRRCNVCPTCIACPICVCHG